MNSNSWTRLPIEPREPQKKVFRVYLFRAPNCIRGWLSHVRLHPKSGEPTVTVELEELTSAKAKNRAISLANQNFEGLKVVKVNRSEDGIWGANQFPELDHIKVE